MVRGNTGELEVVPKHVAIIMDGNGRWAESHAQSRLQGHRAGTQNLDKILDVAIEIGISYLTVYAFSTENWSRPDSEVSGLMALLAENLRGHSRSLNSRDIRLHHIGRLDRLPSDLQRVISEIIEETRDNAGLDVSLAFDYGGRQEILEATKAMIRDAIPFESVDAELFQHYLYTAGTPDPDLIIRTAGEQRMSNFLLWQSAYSEYYSAECYWPDFDDQEFMKAIIEYRSRQRKYGGL